MFSKHAVGRLSRWLGIGLPLVSVVFVSCGGEDELSCGKGTKQSGSTCVPVLTDMGGAGGGPSQSDVEFDGATGVAPVSPTVLLVTWGEVTPADATFNIYVSKRKDGFNFASPQATAPAGSRAIELPGLDEDTEYFVIVRASLDGVEDENTVVLSATTQVDDEAPDFAGATKAAPGGAAAVKLSWAAATDNLTPKASIQYVVYMGEKSDEIDLEAPFTVSAPGATSVVVKNLPLPDTEYWFVVRARDAAGNTDENPIVVSAKSGPDTTAPAFSGCTGAEAKSASEIQVFWQPAVDDTAKADQLVYEVFASKTLDHNFSQPAFVSTAGAISGLVPGLARNTQYYLVCRAKDPAGNSDENTVLRSAKTKEDGEPPEFMGVPTISEVSPTTFKLSWSAATDAKTDADDLVYDVFLAKATGQQDFTTPPHVTSAKGAISVVVEGLDTNTTYYAVVKARDLAGNLSTNTDEATATTLVSFGKDVRPIFSLACNTCHGETSGSAGGGMSLLPQDAYTSLLGPSGTGEPAKNGAANGGLRIAPGVPADSFLYLRVTATDDPLVDDALIMPLSGAPLTAPQKATIAAWITQGALNN